MADVMDQSGGPLRIVKSAVAMQAGGRGGDGYIGRLAKMAPAEVIAFYLTFRPVAVGHMTHDQVEADFIALSWPWVCFFLALAFRAWATREDARWLSFQPVPTAVAGVAFMMWVLAMGHEVAGLSYLPLFHDPRGPSLLSAVFTFAVPYFYKGDRPRRPSPSAKPKAVNGDSV